MKTILTSILDEKPSIEREQFLALYQQTNPCADIEAIRAQIKNRLHDIKRGFGPNSVKERWYSSLGAGRPDYAIYDGSEYLVEARACWEFYSRRYVKGIARSIMREKLEKQSEFLDLGCGIGYTSAALASEFLQARVTATNRETSEQFRICEAMAIDYGFEIVPDLSKIQQVDVVFAFEYFEHFQKPIQHLLDVLSLRPRMLFLANAFGTRSIGHFDQYTITGASVPAAKVQRIFNEVLRKNGYREQNCFWNNRPSVWESI